MAITPRQAREQAKPTQEEMKRLEDIVDKALVENMKKGGCAYIDVSIFPTSIARETIIQCYRNAGWSVQYRSDQRDDDYLEFKENNNTGYGAYGYD